MLIIAQPKSASSSLVKTIGQCCGLYGHVSAKPQPKSKLPRGYSELCKYHTTIVYRRKSELKKWITDNNLLMKEHVIPEQAEAVNSINGKKVLLLRNVADSVDCYVRLGEKNNYKVNIEKIYNELDHYQKSWLDKKDSNIITVWYRELMLNYKQTMGKVLNAFGVVYNNIPALEREQYTGVGVARL